MGQNKISGARTAALALTMVLSTSCATVAEHAEDGQKEPTETTNPYLESLQRSVDDAQQAPDSVDGNISPPFIPQYVPDDGSETGIDSTFIQELRRAIEEAERTPENFDGIILPATDPNEHEGPS